VSAPAGGAFPAGTLPGRGHVLVAPDKFRGTLTAAQAAAHVAAGLSAARPGLDVRQIPVADGGDGTVAAAAAAGYETVTRTVRGPTGQPTQALWAWRDGTAIVEAAQACGLAQLPAGQPAPLTATSYGVGELVGAAVARGARRVVLGLGGVACTDGGAGMVAALGARLTDRFGRPLEPGGAGLAQLDRLNLITMKLPRDLEVLIASDVTSPLLGPDGAAAVYGPQKGASAADVAALERGLARWAELAEGPQPAPVPAVGSAGEDAAPPRPRDRPGAGAAGGLGFAALTLLGAQFRPGIELVLDLLGFAAALAGARLVVTGEGALDGQTLRGKAPAGVARAVAAGLTPPPVVAVSGLCTLTPEQLSAAGFAAAYPLTSVEPDPERCRAQAGPLLEQVARRVAADWLPAGG